MPKSDDSNLIDESKTVAAIVAGENVNLVRTDNGELIADRLHRFIIITIVTGFLLCGALGYESLVTANAVHEVQMQQVSIEGLRVDRSTQAAAQRAASCEYTKQFVAAFHAWATRLAAATALERVSTHTTITNLRVEAYHDLFTELDVLGNNACASQGAIK